MNISREANQPFSITVQGAEFIQQFTEEGIENQLPGGISGAVVDFVHTYAGMPDQAGPQAFDFVRSLPGFETSADMDSYTVYLILHGIRDGLFTLLREDREAERLFKRDVLHQDVDLSAAKDNEPTTKHRDDSIRASSRAILDDESKTFISDDEVSNTVFGGNAEEFHETIRSSAHLPVELEQFRFILPAQTIGYLGAEAIEHTVVVKEQSFIQENPGMAFSKSIRWLIDNSIDVSTGKKFDDPRGHSFPRIAKVMNENITSRYLLDIIKQIRTAAGNLRSPDLGASGNML